MRIMFAHIKSTANVPDGPVKYPVTKDNPNYRPFSGYKNRCFADFLVYYW